MSTHEEMIKGLEKRRATAPKQINNADLHAGSAMTYYCRQCGHVSDVRGESNFTPVQRHCAECADMINAGWIDGENRFVEMKRVQCKECSGSGELSERRSSFGKSYTHRRRCPTCIGTGTVLERV